MGVVLHEPAHPHDAVQRARWLVAHAGAELRDLEQKAGIIDVSIVPWCDPRSQSEGMVARLEF
jgi:hypothetical protein